MGVLAHVACVAGFLQLSLQEEFASVSVLRPTLRLGRGLGWQHRKEVEEPSKRSWQITRSYYLVIFHGF